MRKPILTGATLAALATIVGCGDDSTTNNNEPTVVIPLGGLADSTGTSATILYSAALNLAATQMNEGLSQAGSNIRFDLQVRDSQSSPDVARPQVVELINESGIKGLVSDNSGTTVAMNMLNYASEGEASRQVPIACYLCSSAFINNPDSTNADAVRQAAERDADNWLFRTFFINRFEAIVQTQIAVGRANGGDVNNDGLFKLAVYAVNDSYGRSSADAVIAGAEALHDGNTVVEVIYVEPSADANSYDWSADLALLMDNHNEETNATDGEPDAIFLSLLPLATTAAARAYSEGGYTAPIQSTTAFRRNYILRSLGEAAEGMEGNSPPLYADNASGATFFSTFQDATGEGPEMGCAGAYDSAVSLMLASLQAAVGLENPSDVTSAAVREQMTHLNEAGGEVVGTGPAEFERAIELILAGTPINYEGASGASDYDGAGDVYPKLVHWRVTDGAFAELESYDCSSDPLCPLAQ